MIQDSEYTVYDENKKSLACGNNYDGYFPVINVGDPSYDIYFIKLNNQIYGFEAVEPYRYYDLIPYTETNVFLDGELSYSNNKNQGLVITDWGIRKGQIMISTK